MVQTLMVPTLGMRRPVTIHGWEVSHTPSLCTNSDGINPNGTNPNGTNPNGTNPNGTNPIGANSKGTNPNGANSRHAETSDDPRVGGEPHALSLYKL
jgi:hypothetical protein